MDRKTKDVKCKNCGLIFRTLHTEEKYKYCSGCRKYHKKCEICEKEIFIQARTCSKKCAYELRKQSWQKTCGANHNFCKTSKSRKKWEEKLLKEEGITNVFQREDVKEKCKISHISNLGVDNPSKSEKIKQKKKETLLKNYGTINGWRLTQKYLNPKKYRKKMEDSGIWIPVSSLNEYQIYCYNVWQITYQSIELYGEEKFKNLRNKNKGKLHKDKFSIDHVYSISEGFKNKISPEIIGSIVNLNVLTISENSSKNKRCLIGLNTLINNYNNFINENKIN